MHAAASFLQFNVEQPQLSGKKECFRAIEESAAYVSYGHLKILESITRNRPKEIVFCGGAYKGFLWPQIVADVFGLTVKVPVVKEATALGASICAGVGAGLYTNIPDTAEKLEKDFATFCSTNYSVAVNSGTDALRFALMAAGVQSGDADRFGWWGV